MGLRKGGGTNPNRMKPRVIRAKVSFVKSKTQTPQVGKSVRKY